MKIALLSSGTDLALELERDIKELLKACDILNVSLGEGGSPLCKETTASCDCILAVGGDGTIIRAAKLAASLDIPVLGINAGNLGFNAALERDELPLLKNLVLGKYEEERRLMLKVELNSVGKTSAYCALNEAVVSGELARLISYDLVLGNGKSFRFKGDGFLVSTPTGSTAYSLSAGGPVVEPALKCLIYTPICPHAFFNRSLVFGGDMSLMVTLPKNPGQVCLTVDGETPVPLREGDRLRFSRSRREARFLKIKDKGFFEVLDNKLINSR